VKEAAMVKILLLQGANLTFLGRREPEIYGSTTPADLDAMLRYHAHDHAYQLEIFYTNIEGEANNRIYQAVDEGFDGLVMNPNILPNTFSPHCPRMVDVDHQSCSLNHASCDQILTPLDQTSQQRKATVGSRLDVDEPRLEEMAR
jgi:hypothetical protein